MKLLYIANGYPPHRWAGTETYTASLAKGMHQLGHDVQVLCIGEWRRGAEYWNGYTDSVHDGVRVRRINLNWKKSPKPFEYLFNNPVVGDFLEGYFHEIKPDLVHVTSCETLSASIIEVAHRNGFPLVLSLTDFWFLCPQINLLKYDGSNCDGNTTPWECLKCRMWNSKAYRLPSSVLPESVVSRSLMFVSQYPSITRVRGLRGMAGDMGKRKIYLHEALHKPDAIITASPFVRDIFQSNGLKAPIRVQPYGHDLTWLDDYQGKTTSDKIRFGYIGQLSSSKGVHLLLHAAKVLHGRLGNRFELQVYGNLKHHAEYSAQLEKLAHGFEQVTFCGTYKHEQSAQVFTNIDVLVVPSLWYDFPLVIYEAFATGTPVVATNLGGMAEAVTHNLNGLLFERGDHLNLADQLERILTEDGLLARLKSGIEPVKRIEEELNEYEELYLSLASKRTAKNKERVS